MSAATFDTLAYAKRLRAVGFTEEQAEAQAEALRSVVEENLATKQDLKELEARIRADLRAMEFRITLPLGGMIVAGVAVLAVLMKVL